MAHQTIVTEAGEELVVLPRREYDGLLARLGDEEAEDRVAGLMVEAHRGRRAADAERLLPAWLAAAIAEGGSALATIRMRGGMSHAELTGASGVSGERIDAIEGGEHATEPERRALARALQIDPGWLSP